MYVDNIVDVEKLEMVEIVELVEKDIKCKLCVKLGHLFVFCFVYNAGQTARQDHTN